MGTESIANGGYHPGPPGHWPDHGKKHDRGPEGPDHDHGWGNDHVEGEDGDRNHGDRTDMRPYGDDGPEHARPGSDADPNSTRASHETPADARSAAYHGADGSGSAQMAHANPNAAALSQAVAAQAGDVPAFLAQQALSDAARSGVASHVASLATPMAEAANVTSMSLPMSPAQWATAAPILPAGSPASAMPSGAVLAGAQADAAALSTAATSASTASAQAVAVALPANTGPALPAAATLPLAVAPSQVASDVRGGHLPLAVNDRAALRSDGTLGGVYTADGPMRKRNLRGRGGTPERMTRWWLALGLTARQTDTEEPAPQRESWFALQWLLWLLAIIGYACLAVALIVSLPGGSGLLDERATSIGRYALVFGLAASLLAWWAARRLLR